MTDSTHEAHCDAPDGHAWDRCVSTVTDVHGLGIWRIGSRVSVGDVELDRGQWADVTRAVESLFGVPGPAPITVP